jgi:hypothetical protein
MSTAADLRSNETKYIDAEIARAVAAERERCAKIADRRAAIWNGCYEAKHNEAMNIAAEIRAQRQNK